MPRSSERQSQPENRGSSSGQIGQIEQQIQAIINSSAVVQEDPAEMLNTVWGSAEFAALEPEEQAELRARYGAAQGGEAGPSEPEKDRPAAPERTEKKESRGGRPKTWVFDNYVLKQDPETGAFLIFENKSKYNEKRGIYQKNRQPRRTAISLPPELAEQLRRQPDVGPQVIEFCEKLRRELDMDGALPIHFDRPKKKGGDRLPKWTPTFGGKRQEERFIVIAEENPPEAGDKSAEVDPSLLPPFLNDLAQEYWRTYDPIYEEEKRDNPRMSGRDLNARVRSRIPEDKWYFSKRHNARWSDWEGNARQRLREDIITEELAKQRFVGASGAESAPDVAAPETAAAETAPPDDAEYGTADESVNEPAAETASEQPAAAETAPEPVRAEAAAPRPGIAEPSPEPEKPAARPEAREDRRAERLDEQLLDLSQPIFRDLLPVIGKFYEGREKEDKLAILKHVTKSTLETLKNRFERSQDKDGLHSVLRLDFAKKLAGQVAKEFTRQEAARKFFDEHTFFDEKTVEVLDRNSVAFALDKSAGENEPAVLESVARQLVFDALYGGAGERGDDPAGDETRLVKLVAETLRRLKDQRADIVDFDASTRRLAITDLEALRRIIRSKARRAE